MRKIKIIITFSIFLFTHNSPLFSQQIKHHSFTVVKNEGKYGIVEDKTGDLIVSFQYDTIVNLFPFGGVYILNKGNKYGTAKYIRQIESDFETLTRNDTSYWEFSEINYDTIIFNDEYRKSIVLKKDNVYTFQVFNIFYIPQLDNGIHYYNTKDKAFIEEVYESSNSYDTIFAESNLIIYKKSHKYGIHLTDFGKELPIQWDSISKLTMQEEGKYIGKVLVWKNGKAAILKTNWDINKPEIAESRNFILTSPYYFSNESDFFLSSTKLFVNLHNQPLRIIDLNTFDEITLLSNDNSCILRDTSKYYVIYFDFVLNNHEQIITQVKSRELYENQKRNSVYKLLPLKENITTCFLFWEQVYYNNIDGSAKINYSDINCRYEIIHTIKGNGDIVLSYNLDYADSNTVPVTFYSAIDKEIIKQYTRKNRFFVVEDGIIYAMKVSDLEEHIRKGGYQLFGHYRDSYFKKIKICGYIIFDYNINKYRIVRYNWMTK